jgi:hypothetical protein
MLSRPARRQRAVLTGLLNRTAAAMAAPLLDHATFGSGFDSLEFKIREDGSILVDQAFTTLFAAESCFDDRVLDLGTFAFGSDLHLVFDFNLVASDIGDGFGQDFILGAASRVVITPRDMPEPGTLPLFGFGLAALLIIIRRRPYYYRKPYCGAA